MATSKKLLLNNMLLCYDRPTAWNSVVTRYVPCGSAILHKGTRGGNVTNPVVSII